MTIIKELNELFSALFRWLGKVGLIILVIVLFGSVLIFFEDKFQKYDVRADTQSAIVYMTDRVNWDNKSDKKKEKIAYEAIEKAEAEHRRVIAKSIHDFPLILVSGYYNGEEVFMYYYSSYSRPSELLIGADEIAKGRSR